MNTNKKGFNGKKTDIWLCGPNNFAKKLQSDFAQLGFNASKFHHELFEIR
ncbi:MAG: putative ferric reductase [Psychromonas sp.]|jgi:predicted ferric reductase